MNAKEKEERLDRLTKRWEEAIRHDQMLTASDLMLEMEELTPELDYLRD